MGITHRASTDSSIFPYHCKGLTLQHPQPVHFRLFVPDEGPAHPTFLVRPRLCLEPNYCTHADPVHAARLAQESLEFANFPEHAFGLSVFLNDADGKSPDPRGGEQCIRSGRPKMREPDRSVIDGPQGIKILDGFDASKEASRVSACGTTRTELRNVVITPIGKPVCAHHWYVLKALRCVCGGQERRTAGWRVGGGDGGGGKKRGKYLLTGGSVII
ncbi:hypothetical protein B0H13DRAFT_1894445 [Mycena leptocephala]|nr:hypothetical protein B0H13DRAFT_1894445 [Mycena leptocephala]